MKNLITGLALLGMLSVLSCTKIIYTHEQVLARYKTKSDVANALGTPTEKNVSDSTEAWLYKYEGHKITSEFKNANTVTVASFNQYKKYVIFSFDKQGNVTRCDYHGVDLTERKFSTGKTIALVSAGVVVLALIVLATIAAKGAVSWQ